MPIINQLNLYDYVCPRLLKSKRKFPEECGSNLSKRDFRYYYARGCFEVSKNLSESQKMTYLTRAINSYNKYLKRNLKLQIRNTSKISSKIISDSVREQSNFTSSISDAFLDSNKLKPVEFVLNLLNIEKTENFLVKESNWNKIKDSGAFLATIIPVIISAITLILKYYELTQSG